jgi:hypothetical protein
LSRFGLLRPSLAERDPRRYLRNVTERLCGSFGRSTFYSYNLNPEVVSNGGDRRINSGAELGRLDGRSRVPERVTHRHEEDQVDCCQGRESRLVKHPQSGLLQEIKDADVREEVDQTAILYDQFSPATAFTPEMLSDECIDC